MRRHHRICRRCRHHGQRFWGAFTPQWRYFNQKDPFGFIPPGQFGQNKPIQLTTQGGVIWSNIDPQDDASFPYQGNLRFRHNKGTTCNAGFADGSVRQFTGKFKGDKQLLQEGVNPTHARVAEVLHDQVACGRAGGSGRARVALYQATITRCDGRRRVSPAAGCFHARTRRSQHSSHPPAGCFLGALPTNLFFFAAGAVTMTTRVKFSLSGRNRYAVHTSFFTPRRYPGRAPRRDRHHRRAHRHPAAGALGRASRGRDIKCQSNLRQIVQAYARILRPSTRARCPGASAITGSSTRSIPIRITRRTPGRTTRGNNPNNLFFCFSSQVGKYMNPRADGLYGNISDDGDLGTVFQCAELLQGIPITSAMRATWWPCPRRGMSGASRARTIHGPMASSRRW